MSSTILNDIVRDYEAISTSWFSALGPIAHKIFWILVAIQLTWSAIWWVLDREDGLAVVSSLLRQVVAIGFFYALLLNGGTWVPAVIQSFSQAGATAAGITDLSPTGVFESSTPSRAVPKRDPSERRSWSAARPAERPSLQGSSARKPKAIFPRTLMPRA